MQFRHRLTASPLAYINKLRTRRTLIRAAGNTGWLLVNQGLRLVGTLVIGVWVARYLGPEQYGIFNYAIAYVGLFTSVVPLGLNQINLRDLAVAPEERNTILGSSMGLQLLAAAAVLTVSLSIALWSQGDSPITRSVILIISLNTLLRPLDTITFWWRSQHRSAKIVLANAASLLFMVVVRSLLVLNEASLQAFAWVIVAEQAVFTATTIYLYQREGTSILDLRWDSLRAKTSLKEGIPFLLSSLATSAFVRGNQIMVKEIAGATANGYFAAASRISDLWSVVPQTLVSSAMPVISQAKLAGQAEYERKLVFLFRICSLVGLLGAATVSFLAPYVVPLLFGSQYRNATEILIIQIWYTLPQAINASTVPWIVNEGLAHVTFQKTVTQAVIVLALNFVLIPRYEGTGAAYSILIASFITGVAWDFVDPRLNRLSYLKLRAWFPWWYSPSP